MLIEVSVKRLAVSVEGLAVSVNGLATSFRLPAALMVNVIEIKYRFVSWIKLGHFSYES